LCAPAAVLKHFSLVAVATMPVDTREKWCELRSLENSEKFAYRVSSKKGDDVRNLGGS
jgi:hypothetical protein